MIKKEIVKAKPGRDVYVRDFPYWGVVLLLESDPSLGESSPVEHTLKGKEGNKLFSFSWSTDYPSGASVMFLPEGIGIFRSRTYESDPRDGYAELLTWDGSVMGKIDHLLSITFGSIATMDKRHMVLLTDGTAVFVGDGQEIWRKSFPSPVSATISNDGQYVCICNAGCVYVYSREGDSLYSHLFSSHDKTNPYSSFSPHNKYLAAAATAELVLIDNTTGKLLWKRKVEGDKFTRNIQFAKNGEYIILSHKSTQHVYIFDLSGNLQHTLKLPFGEVLERISTKEGEIKEIKLPFRHWSCRAIDDLLIITAEKEPLQTMFFQLR